MNTYSWGYANANLNLRFTLFYLNTPIFSCVQVSKFPIGSFTRNLFCLLQSEVTRSIPQILLNLCETPMVPATNTEYNVKLSTGSASISFSSVDITEDFDVNLIGMTLLSPQMLLSAWEAIMLERKLLVVSADPGIIPTCCEFIRRLVLPLSVINTYVPLLPEKLMGTIEAPFPYVLGVNLNLLRGSMIDTSESLMLDLDNRCVIEPDKLEQTTSAPKEIKEKLIQDINEIIMGSMTKWIQRTAPGNGHQGRAEGKAVSYPFSEHSINAGASAITQCFIRVNLQMLNARSCNVRAFYRHPFVPVAATPGSVRESKSRSTGYTKRNAELCYGCMQLVVERLSGPIQLIPCWIEMDRNTILVYQFADELPLIPIFTKNVISVFPSPMEPDGHVFDINVKPQKNYRFVALDSESRFRWIEEIEGAIQALKAPAKDTPISSPPSSQTFSRESSFMMSGDNSGKSVDRGKSEMKIVDESMAVECEKELELTLFRSALLQTQMVSYLKSRLEFEDYEVVLNEIGLDSTSLTERKYPNDLPLDLNGDSRERPYVPLEKDDSTAQELVSAWSRNVAKDNLDELVGEIVEEREKMTVDMDCDALGDPDLVGGQSSMIDARPPATTTPSSSKMGIGKTIKQFFKRSSVSVFGVHF
jgi:hypothetical protein